MSSTRSVGSGIRCRRSVRVRPGDPSWVERRLGVINVLDHTGASSSSRAPGPAAPLISHFSLGRFLLNTDADAVVDCRAASALVRAGHTTSVRVGFGCYAGSAERMRGRHPDGAGRRATRMRPGFVLAGHPAAAKEAPAPRGTRGRRETVLISAMRGRTRVRGRHESRWGSRDAPRPQRSMASPVLPAGRRGGRRRCRRPRTRRG